MTLRLATEDDYPMVLEMARRFHQASPYTTLEFDTKRCREVFDEHLRDPSTTVIIVFDHGMIIGQKGSPAFSTTTVTTELAWWVDETHRGSKESLSLLKAYQDWAVRVGAVIIQMAMLDDSINLDKLYRRHGFSPAERSYIKVI